VLDVAEAWGYLATGRLTESRRHLDSVLAITWTLTRLGPGFLSPSHSCVT
jgi:hypothetical protein